MELSIEDFLAFRKENPLNFTTEELKKICEDVLNLRSGVVYDETVDFCLWKKGLKTRQQYMAEYVKKRFPKEQFPRLLEVGCGKQARLSKLLVENGYEMTAMDPFILLPERQIAGLLCISESFDYRTTDVSGVDAVIAQEPCEAAEHIIRACTAVEKSFCISLCGAPHRLISGEEPETLAAWHEKLLQAGNGGCRITKQDLIPGYISHFAEDAFFEILSGY